MKSKIILFIIMLSNVLVFAQVGAPSVLPIARIESDFFTDNSASFPAGQRVTLVNNTGDDSSTLNTAINFLNNLGGGVITINAGTWEFAEILMKSNVHLVISKDAIIKPSDCPTCDITTSNRSIFRIGSINATVTTENVSIRSLNDEGQFTIDMSGLEMVTVSGVLYPVRITPFNMKAVYNFMISGCNVIDNYTIHAAMNCSASKTSAGVWGRPKQGLIKNLTVQNAHGGYGAVQVRSGERLFFKNITSLGGGVTLRIETDDVSASNGATPQTEAWVSEISAYNIKCANGNAAVMLQPWSATNGWVDVQKIEATSCMAAVRIDKSYDKVSPFVGVGIFDSDSRITDVTCSYGTNAQVKEGVFSSVPCVLRMNPTILIYPGIAYMDDGAYHQGPSITPLLYRASGAVGDGYYSVNVPTEVELKTNASGFDWSISLGISRDNNQVTTCPAVDGIFQTTGNWYTASNWASSTIATGSATLTASPTVDAPVVCTAIVTSGSNPVTIGGTAELTINASSTIMSINASATTTFNGILNIGLTTAQNLDVAATSGAKLVFSPTSILNLSSTFTTKIRNSNVNPIEFNGILTGTGGITVNTNNASIVFGATADNATYKGTIITFAKEIVSNIVSPQVFLPSEGTMNLGFASGALTLNGADTMKGKLSRATGTTVVTTSIVNFNANQPNMGVLTLSGSNSPILKFVINSAVTNLKFASTNTDWGTTAKLDIVGFKDDVLFIGGTALTSAQLNAITLSGVAQIAGYFSQRANGAIVKTTSLGTATTWIGTISTDWTNASNWSSGIPSSNSDVTIGTGIYQPIIASNVSIKYLYIASGSSLNVSNGSTLTVSGAIANSGAMTLANNANLIQSGTTNSNSGNIIVNRNSNALKRLDYTIWSSPVSGSLTLAQFSPNTSQSPSRFYSYNSALNQYNAITTPTTSIFATATGYLIRMPNTDPTVGYDAGSATLMYAGVFTGIPNNGTITQIVTLAGNGYNLVGNPYPSTIDANTFFTANANIASSLYLWRKTNNLGSTAYAVYSNAGGTAASSNSEVPNGTIQVGQGFFVKANSGTSVSFTNAMRLNSTSTQFFKTAHVQKDRIWLNLTNDSGAFSQTLVAYMEGGSQEVDDLDAKYINDSPIALTSNINNEEYTIQARPKFDPTDVVALNFKTDLAGDYSIALDHSDGLFATTQDVYLVDSTTGTETNLKATAYTFNAAAGTDNARFSLKYQKTLKTDAVSLNDNGVTVYKDKGVLYVSSNASSITTIRVYDVQGKLIAEQKNDKSNSATFANLKTTHQVLIVQVSTSDNKVVSKKIVDK